MLVRYSRLILFRFITSLHRTGQFHGIRRSVSCLSSCLFPQKYSTLSHLTNSVQIRQKRAESFKKMKYFLRALGSECDIKKRAPDRMPKTLLLIIEKHRSKSLSLLLHCYLCSQTLHQLYLATLY